MKFKKVLIVNCNFNLHEGTGVTVSNFFSGWPLDKIANAFHKVFVDKTKCINYYQLNKGPVILGNDEKIEYRKKINILDKNKKRNIIKQSLVGFKNLLELYGLINKVHVDSKFLNWIHEFKPEFIYIVLFTNKDIPFVRELIRKTKSKIIVHIYDDWVYHNRNGFLNFIVGPIVRLKFANTIRKIDYLFCISDKMSKEYQKRYSIKCHTLHNPVDIEKWNFKADILKSKIYNIIFVGTVGEHNITEFKVLIDAIKQLNISIEINLYGSIRKKYILDELSEIDIIKINGLVDYLNVPNILNTGDILFLPLSFRESQRRYIQYSMPTKFTEYLASGKPILLLAPKDFALSEYASKYNCAEIINDLISVNIAERIRSIIETSGEPMISNALELVKNRHSIELVQNRIFNIMKGKIGK